MAASLLDRVVHIRTVLLDIAMRHGSPYSSRLIYPNVPDSPEWIYSS
jgi:hypothetical protein